MYNSVMRKIKFSITDKDGGREIRDYLRSFGVSSSLLTRLKKTENGITVNGNFARAIDRLSPGDILEISIESRGKMPEPSGERLEILYEDEDILAVNKPAFMPVHESRNHRGDALSNAVAGYMTEETAFRAVYRLDRDTSGIVLIAKNELAAAKLAGKIKKDYYAVACGEIKTAGVIDAPIARLDKSIIKRCVCESGERAVTHYEPVCTCEKYTLLKINLETGRTHQIRVHFSDMGYPLLGDTLYGEESSLIGRQALHCKTVYFRHPVTGKEISVSSDFPQDIKNVIEKEFEGKGGFC